MTASAGETHTDSGTISVSYTGSLVNGSIGLSAGLNTAVNTSSSTARPYVTISGDNDIADGTIVAELLLSAPTVNLLSLIGWSDSNSITQFATFNPKGPGVTLTLHFNGATAASCVFTGG